MSQQLGRMLTCDRCGKTVFQPMRKEKDYVLWNNDEGAIFFESTDGWTEPSSYKLKYAKGQLNDYKNQSICSECNATLKDIVNKFWSNE